MERLASGELARATTMLCVMTDSSVPRTSVTRMATARTHRLNVRPDGVARKLAVNVWKAAGSSAQHLNVKGIRCSGARMALSSRRTVPQLVRHALMALLHPVVLLNVMEWSVAMTVAEESVETAAQGTFARKGNASVSLTVTVLNAGTVVAMTSPMLAVLVRKEAVVRTVSA